MPTTGHPVRGGAALPSAATYLVRFQSKFHFKIITAAAAAAAATAAVASAAAPAVAVVAAAAAAAAAADAAAAAAATADAAATVYYKISKLSFALFKNQVRKEDFGNHPSFGTSK